MTRRDSTTTVPSPAESLGAGRRCHRRRSRDGAATTTTAAATKTPNRCVSFRPRTPVFAFLAVAVVCFSSSIVGAHRWPWLAATVPTPVAATKTTTATPSARRLPWTTTTSPTTTTTRVPRGGGSTENDSDTENDTENDEERYSRQVYTMGARAHGLIRSSCVCLDGPIRSGLLWESAKNLALSGVGRLVVLVDDDEMDGNDASEGCYHVPELDDLGEAYIRGAANELEGHTRGSTGASRVDLERTLVDFLKRLNPALEVSKASRKAFRESETKENNENNDGGGGILLCVDRPYKRQEEWNRFCRSRTSSAPWKFVSVETAGVYGRIFCDFGESHEIHDADGETPLVVPLDRVDAIERESNDDDDDNASATTVFLVRSVEGEHHDVSRDDIVVFQRSDGSVMEEIPCRVTRVHTPEKIRVEVLRPDDDNENENHNEQRALLESINAEAVSFSRRKQIEEVSFRSLGDTTRGVYNDDGGGAIFTPCDLDKSFDGTRRRAVFDSFQALGAFVDTHGKMPRSGDAASFFELAQSAGGEDDDANNNNNEEWKAHCSSFLRTSPAKFVPLQAIFGAIASQECLKAASGLYTPIRQFLLYDCDEVLAEANDDNDEEDYENHTGLSYVLGRETTRRLENQKLFVVGSGAIGCEILKNVAAMGAGTGKSGSVVVTDMDTIEKSNLSRQLLFRDSDIGKFKSKAAGEAVHRMNPSVRVETHTSKVGDEEDPGHFDEKFWSKGVDVILNALDNMEARLFMDGQCVANQKALIDAGTLGSKGNVQVVVPHQSESYGSSVDPPEPAIPVCTLKNFPYAISHTIQWGRDLFDGLYVRRPRQVNQYTKDFMEGGTDRLVDRLDDDMGDEAAVEAAKELAEDLSVLLLLGDDADGATVEASMKHLAIEWAIGLGRELFSDSIDGLLSEHPIEELDEDGEPFWSGSRKPPKPLSFSLVSDGTENQQEEVNANMIYFVRSAARLRYETYTGIPSNAKDNVVFFSADAAKEALIGAAEKELPVAEGAQDEDSKPCKRDLIRERLATLDGLSDTGSSAPIRPLSAAEFEKDDESNDHITFITAASNLRAICYGIAPVDSMETRKVAGRIIPAMITTTAFVSALSCMEFVKLTQGMPLNRHRNAFINLALPFFAFTSPLPAEEYAGVRGETHTLWDRITIKEGKKAAQSGGLTLRRFLRRIQKKAYAEDPDAVQVSNISIGPIMIYANFLHEDDEELLNKSIWQVIEEAMQSGEEFDEEFSRDGPETSEETKDSLSISSVSFIDLAVSVEDTETFDEVELPQVRLIRSK